MPRGIVDYSNTIIYKITCKTPSVTQYFVGHTTNLSQKKRAIKITCNDSSKKDYNLKMYQIIRENGGWDNWTVTELAKYNCKNAKEAYIRECEHRLQLEQEMTYETKTNKIISNQIITDSEINTDSSNNTYTYTYGASETDMATDRKPDLSISLHSTTKEDGTEEFSIDMNDITERDVHVLTTVVLQLINQNLFFKKLIINQNKRIIELSKKLGIPVEEESDEDEELEEKKESS
jgi:hypothetical protein